MECCIFVADIYCSLVHSDISIYIQYSRDFNKGEGGRERKREGGRRQLEKKKKRKREAGRRQIEKIKTKEN